MKTALENINGNTLEMANKYLPLILIIFLLMNCRTPKDSMLGDEKSANSALSDNFEGASDYILNQDSVYQFICNGKKYNLYGRQISRPYFPIDLRNCLLESGFNGNIQANEQLAKIIRMVGKDKMLTLGRNPKFRGKQVFEALLSIGNDYRPIIDYDDGSFDGTKASSISSHYIKMIKSIDGTNFRDFRMKLWQKNKTKIPDEYDPVSLEYNFEYDVAWSKLKYKATKQAWKENKIILKNFGEE